MIENYYDNLSDEELKEIYEELKADYYIEYNQDYPEFP